MVAGRKAGQSLVEFALIVPILFISILAVFDLGDAVYTYNTLAHGSEVAAGYASLHCSYSGSGYTNAQLTQQVLQAGERLQGQALTLSAAPATGAACSTPGAVITITATYRYRPLTGVLQAFFPATGLPFQATATVLAQ